MSQKDLESVVVVLPVSMNRSVFLKTTHVRQIQDFGTPKWMYLPSNCRCPTDALQPSTQLAPRFVVSVRVKTMFGYFRHLPPALGKSDRFVQRITAPFGEERHFDSVWNGTEIPGKPSKTRYAKTLLRISFQFHT